MAGDKMDPENVDNPANDSDNEGKTTGTLSWESKSALLAMHRSKCVEEELDDTKVEVAHLVNQI